MRILVLLSAILCLVIVGGCASDGAAVRKKPKNGLATISEEEAKNADKDRVIIPLSATVIVERIKTASAKCADAAFVRFEMEIGIRECTSAIENDNLKQADLANTYYNRGFLYFQVEKYSEAEADFTKAIENKMTQLHKAYYARGLCRQNTNRAREAAKDYAKALELKPDWTWAQKKKKEFWWAYGDEYPY